MRNVILTGGELLYGAFYNCTNLSNIIFDNSITSIGACAFQKCSGLVAIELPDMLMRLGASAFYNCTNLIEITLGGSIKNIANSSFANCNSLNSVHIKDLDSWCKIVFDNAYANPLYYAKNLYINDELVTDLEISNTIIEIKDYAFCCSSITSVDIGASSKNIGQYAFYNCLQLQKANIGNAIKNIGNYAFNNCINLTDISISNSVETIGNSAFYNCTKLDSLTLGNKLESIGNYAFRDCTSLTSMEIPNSVASIGNGAFGGCSSLENITIPFVGGSATATSASSSTLFGYIFGTSSYSGGTETRQYYSSGSSTYYYIPTSLKTVTITSGKILYGALSGCSKLTSVIVADNVTNIGERAFGGCSSLESITLPFVGGSATATSASSSTLLGYIFGTSSYSGGTKITQYYKSGYSQYYYIPDSLKLVTITGGKILYGAFYNCKYIEKVYISNSIKEIDTNAFYGCNGMKEIYYSGTLEQWNEIIVGNGNDILSTATIYYEYEAKKE